MGTAELWETLKLPHNYGNTGNVLVNFIQSAIACKIKSDDDFLDTTTSEDGIGVTNPAIA